MRKGDATRARILEETARQAALRGFGAVSLNDVAEAVGLSKSGLFKHFESKEAMELVALEQEFDRFVEFVWTPAEALPPGRARLEAIFERWLDWSEVEKAAGGCLIMAASIELDDQPGPLRDLLQKRVRQWRRTLAREMQALCAPPLSDDEVAKVIEGIIASTGASSIKDMGKVMAELKTNYAGQLDMGKAGGVIKQKLSA